MSGCEPLAKQYRYGDQFLTDGCRSLGGIRVNCPMSALVIHSELSEPKNTASPMDSYGCLNGDEAVSGSFPALAKNGKSTNLEPDSPVTREFPSRLNHERR